MNSIAFKKLEANKESFKKIFLWCQNDFVYEWFEQRKLSYDEIVHKYKNKIASKEQEIYLINLDGKDIGLFQVYKFNNDIQLKLDGIIYEFDLFIGEKEYLSKGYGKIIIHNIVDKIIREKQADYIVLRPFEDNIRAINCYKKCGFLEKFSYQDVDTLGNPKQIILMLYTKCQN